MFSSQAKERLTGPRVRRWRSQLAGWRRSGRISWTKTPTPPRASCKSASPRRKRAKPRAKRPIWSSAKTRSKAIQLARQTGRLLRKRPARVRNLSRRGRFGGRQRQTGPRPSFSGDFAVARQDHQRRKEPSRQNSRQRRNSRHDYRFWHRHRRACRITTMSPRKSKQMEQGHR